MVSDAMTRPVRIQYGNRMKFSLDVPSGANLVRAYAPGQVRIGDRAFSRSLIVTASALIEDWRPVAIRELTPEDIDPVLKLRPEVLLIGSGTRQEFPERATLAALYAARLGFEVMDTGAACRTYNLLVAEGRRVAAALIIRPAD
jgi:uncharacterized protein